MKRGGSPSGLDLLVRHSRLEASLWRRFRFEEELVCRQILFDRYAGIARSIARRYFYRRVTNCIDKADLEQFAYEGLLQAIDRYDPLNGAPFGAYASRRIAGSIADGVATMTEVGAQIRHRRRVEQERLRSLAASDAPRGSDDAITVLSDLAIGLALGMMLEGTGLIVCAGAVDPTPSAYESLEWREIQARLAREVGRLPDREATIIRHHYDTGLSFAQIADLLDLSRGRVSQLHKAALEKLREKIGGFV